LSYFALSALIGLSFALTSSFDFLVVPSIIVTLFTIAILITSHSNRLLSSQVMGWIGDRSYTLYLVHWPLIQVAFLFKGAALDLTEKVILLVLLFALSALIFRFYENPLRHSPSLKMNAAKTVTLGIGITLLSVVALMTARTFL
jgi:peptidoglycan/LPS O-acetylase OafA/YrhL